MTLIASLALADERLYGTWYLVPGSLEPKAENSQYIFVLRRDGRVFEVFTDDSGRMDVFVGSEFGVEGDEITFDHENDDPLTFAFRFEGGDKLVFSDEGRESVYHRMVDRGDLPSAAIAFAETGEVRSIQMIEADGRGPFGATAAATIHLHDANGSVRLLEFEGSDISGGVSRAGRDWIVPVNSGVAAMAVGEDPFLDRFQRLIDQVSSE
ncbi:hypothetical protein [Ferruginivarius sediminum]|nr:hypothetical protein [Ferruginivarius sediminum]